MARPIEATPVLTGKAAKLFLSQIMSNEKVCFRKLDLKKIANDVLKLHETLNRNRKK